MSTPTASKRLAAGAAAPSSGGSGDAASPSSSVAAAPSSSIAATPSFNGAAAATQDMAGGEPSGVGSEPRHSDKHMDEVPLRDVEMGEQAPWPLERLRSQAAMPVAASCLVAPSSPTAAVPPLVPSDITTVAELDKWKNLNATRGNAETICPLCLYPNCVNEPPKEFTMVMLTLSGDSQRVTIPCKARSYFKSLVRGTFVMFAWRGIPYAVSVRKKKECTQLSGQWEQFVSDHKLVAGDRVMLEYVSQSRGWRCLPFNKDIVERFPIVSLGMIKERRIDGCSFSKGTRESLSSFERSMLLKRLDETEIPYFKPLVHRLTETDVKKELRLPEWITELLYLSRSGTIIFKDGNNHENFDVVYTVSTDGRAICYWTVRPKDPIPASQRKRKQTKPNLFTIRRNLSRVPHINFPERTDLRDDIVVMLVPAIKDNKPLVVVHKLSCDVS